MQLLKVQMGPDKMSIVGRFNTAKNTFEDFFFSFFFMLIACAAISLH